MSLWLTKKDENPKDGIFRVNQPIKGRFALKDLDRPSSYKKSTFTHLTSLLPFIFSDYFVIHSKDLFSNSIQDSNKRSFISTFALFTQLIEISYKI